jgi:aspartyl-tRNA(Asn)/glutamyl-tRNA(Gln) amidotransferase subunit A
MAPACELSKLMAQGSLSSAELVEAYLRRIERSDVRLGAFTEVFAEEAMRQAEQRDRERARGCILGPLHGIPVVFKDLVDIEGRRTTAGSRLYDGYVAPRTASIVTRLELAGMVTLGKNRLVELAYGGWGTNRAIGTPWNPWDLGCHRVPGGSSSGTAVAVAAGLSAVGIGSDTGGSVRIPASMCGLVGLKTTHGQIPTDGLIPLSGTLDTVGTLTRSVKDAALVYTALSYATRGAASREPDLSGDIRGYRIGVLAGTELQDTDTEVLKAYAATIDLLTASGAEVVEFNMDQHFEALVGRNGIFIAYEGWQAHGDRIAGAPEKMDPAVLARFRQGQKISVADFDAAQKRRELDQQNFMESMRDIDFLLTPTTPMTAIPLENVNEDVLPLNRYTRAVNYFGLCGLAVPAGLDSRGLPMSVQFVGKPDSEPRLINIGLAYEIARGPRQSADISTLL